MCICGGITLDPPLQCVEWREGKKHGNNGIKRRETEIIASKQVLYSRMALFSLHYDTYEAFRSHERCTVCCCAL